MNKILAIASISLRTTVRSKIVLSLIVILMMVIIGLPLSIKSDATISGEVQILVIYTLGIVIAILSIATLWAGCAAISGEIAERQIHMVVSKPVTRFQILLGKWVSLVALNAALLCVSGLAVYGLLRWNTRPSQLNSEEIQQLDEEILVARRQIRPQIPDVDLEAGKTADEWMKAPDFPREISRADAVEEARKTILRSAFSVPPGTTITWKFDLPSGVRKDQPFHIRYKFASGRMEITTIRGTWTIGGPDVPGRATIEGNDTAEGFHTMRVQDDVFSADGTLEVSYKNTNDQRPVTIFFPPQDGISVFVYSGGFEINLVRTLLILLLHLSFLSAIGVVAGSLFSLPTAAFTALYLVVLLKFIPYIEIMAARKSFVSGPGQQGSAFLDIFLILFYRGMQFLVSPLKSPNPLDSLGIGELVPWSWVASVFVLKVVVYGGAIALIGRLLFYRRELGLPS